VSEPLTELEVRIIRGALFRAFVLADACTFPDDDVDMGREQSKKHYEEALTLTARLLEN
jgi:hypothetical protein